ncbi:PAX-interacting protein 1 [Psilocybe cubensis]|uniref:BRCT domain-containing protein n=2 Tax=Psilocybe cubensis TaxID=181762 RepID=A0A8H7XKV6_PSICU|nr:PAX-interacting protein 1 [Psilocybe cubensis]KAH9483371.1 PAX-interacting protein 1 [Psilocybe cubensis]
MTRDPTNSNLQPYPIQHDSEQKQDDPSLFDGTVYHISPSLPPTLVAQLDALLLANGARRAGNSGSQGQQIPSTSQHSQIQAQQQQPPTQDPTLTIVISDSLRFPGWEDIARRRAREAGSGVPDEVTGEEKYSVHVVLPAWVERGVVLGKMQHPAHYSPDPSLLFSSLTCSASTTSLSPSDIITLQAGVTSLGGQWRSSLTREVTHLFALSREGREYETAMHFQRETGVKVLLPHWFDDVVRLGVRVEEGPYEWPDPELLREREKEKGINTSQGPTKDKEKPTDIDAERARLKRSVFVTAARFTPALTACPPPSQADLDNTHKNGVQPVSSSPGGDGAPASSAVGGVPGAAEGDTSIAHLAPPPTSSFSLPAVVTISAPKVWEERRILLSRTLQLWGRRRDSVQAGIERAGGIVVRFEGDEEEQEEVPISPEDAQENKSNGSTVGKDGERGFGYDERLSRQERRRRRREAERVKDCDVLVTRWREGRGYVEAVRTQKLVGTLAWLFHVQSCGVLSHPLNQLLHYPVPKRRIEGFSAHVITVTNYTGEAREYIKKLVTAMGATFTPTTKATAWSIPIVNHTWLEDCFIAWRNLTPANPKYIIFRTGDDWSRRLGERGVAVGVRNGISGGWGAVVRVGVGEGETQDETQEGQGEERELGRIEQEAEELAEEGDELGDSETDEAEARAEAVAASAPAVGAAGVDAGTGDHFTEVHPPNGTEASMKEVMDDLVDADDAMEIDVDDPGQVDDEDADGVKVSTKKARPVSLEREREKEKGKSSPVKPTFSPRKSKQPAPIKSKSQFKGKPRDSGSDENEEEEGYRKETVIEVPSSPLSEESDDHDERRKEKTKSSGKTPRSASNVKEKSKSKPAKPASETESEADNENKEEDVVAEEAEEERPQSPVLKKSKPKSTPKSAGKASTNTDTKKRAEDKLKVKNRKTRVPGSSDEEDEDEGVEDDTGGNGDAMDVDIDAEHPPKSKAKSTTKMKSKSTNKESPTSKLTPQTSSKVAENGKASSSSKSKSKKTVQVSSGTEDEDEDDNKSAQSTDVELDVEEASKPAPAKKKPLTRRVTVEITVPSPAKGLTAAAAKATGGTGTPSRVSGTTTTTTPSAAPKPDTTPAASTAGGGLLTRMIKVDARTRVKRRKPGDEGKKRKRSDVYVETSESEDEVVEPEQVIAVAKGKSKGKGKEVKARDSVRGKGKQVEEAKVVSPKGKVKAKSQHTKGRKGKKAVSDDDDAEAKVVESEEEVDTEEEENEEIVVSSRKIESTSKTSSSKSKVKPTPKAVAKIKAKDKKAAKVSASSASEEEEKEEEAEEEEDLPPPKKRPGATSKSKKHAPPPSPSQPPERDHAQLSSPSKRKKPLRVYSSPDEEDEEEDEEDSDDGLPLNPFTLSKAEQRAKDAKEREAKERKAAEEEAERQRKKKANSLAKVKGKVEKTYGKGKTAKKVAAAASETESEEEEEEEDKDEDDVPPRKGTKAKAKSKAVDHSPSTLKRGKRRGKDYVDAHGGDQTSVAFGVKRKGKKTAAPSSDEEEEEEEERPARKASKAKPGTTKATSKPKPSAKAKSAKSTLPTESENESEEEDEVSLLVSPSRAARALTRTESLRAVAGQQATSSSAVATPIRVNGVAETSISAADKGRKGGKATNATAATSSKAKAKQSNDAPMDVDDSVSVSISNAGPSAVSAPPRRSAAAKASQRLHETIMPDLVHYESQVKKARRASSHAASSTAFALADEGEDVRVPGPSEKRKKTAGDGEDDQSTADQADGKAVKKRRVGEKAKAKAQDDDMDVDQSLPGQGIVIMTTQVTLADDVVKTLVKLGVKITVRASECTHLLAPHVVRTEKFLCAVASRAPWVLQDRWAIESANARKILPEKGFILKDKSGENKYGVNLVQALERAKENIKDGGLLKGHIFYLTPRVPVDAKLLKNVVVASGGQVSTQTPTLRVISTAPSLRHVISCSDDIAIWRPLTSSKAVRIYTQELLLNGVLKQEMEWEKDDYFVPGSF